MTYIELASYIGMANVIMKQIEAEDESGMVVKIREALCETQMYFSKKAIEDIQKTAEEMSNNGTDIQDS